MAEIPNPEQNPETQELRLTIAKAKEAVESQVKDDAGCAVETAAPLGFFAEMKQISDSHQDVIRDNAFKKIKATAMLAIQLVPIVGEASAAAKTKALVDAGKAVADADKASALAKATAVGVQDEQAASFGEAAFATETKAVKAMADARKAILEQSRPTLIDRAVAKLTGKPAESKAQRVFSKAMGKEGVTELEALAYANRGEIVRTGKDRFVHGLKNEGKMMVKETILEAFNPTPDVPHLVNLAAFGAQMLGFHGAGVVAPLYQVGVSTVQDVKEYWRMGNEMKDAVMRRLDRRVTATKQPDVQAAAKVYESAIPKTP